MSDKGNQTTVSEKPTDPLCQGPHCTQRSKQSGLTYSDFQEKKIANWGFKVKPSGPAQHRRNMSTQSLADETDTTLGIKGWDLAARKLGKVETDTMEKETYYLSLDLIHTSLPREIKELRSQICCSGHRIDEQICIWSQEGTRDLPS